MKLLKLILLFLLSLSCSNPSFENNNISIVINEFMVRNDISTGIIDSDSNYSDWIEIYNASDSSIFLGNFFISDNEEEKFKTVLPGVFLEPKDFLILWGGESKSNKDCHIGFNFSSDKEKGEKIIIFDKDSNIIDSISYTHYKNSTKKAVSFGRKPDASITWIDMKFPTPGACNEW